MTTEFAAWLVKNETEIIVKELRKKNKMVMKPKMEGEPLVNDNYLVRLKNVHPELAKQMKSRYNNANCIHFIYPPPLYLLLAYP